ncbi:homoserine kinase [Nonlabens dokdonensis]|jgi:homoserine kinase|uniref:Homoserine kinase n=2 Tax=Nonlabens dokdonensis TaxID=328515 RepID=L7WE89_NONDD|nr:homoserine kinase [Nonlabens dokdonensis]AGC78419.1 homoserine kinase [Nonlabens dokdonensis DSW-6]PZX38166.1 homoserine kinase [Nonlabens dokdonensis]
MKEIRIFAPATVANVACGFDVLGFCLDSVGDEMVVRQVAKKGIVITKSIGYDLPTEIENNVAGVAAQAFINDFDPDLGIEIEIYKNIKPGSGVGSSAASAAGVVVALNELLGKPYNKEQLTAFAMKGEAVASNCEHADNIAPAIYGGFTLVKSCKPVKILEIPTPSNLFAVIIHPQIEIKTADSRAVLPQEIPLSQAIEQWANVGSLIHALHTSDYGLIKESLHDVVIETHRSKLIPHYDAVKKAALKAGALGCSISGSGPSIFTLNKGKATALHVEHAMRNVYKKTGIEFETYISPINQNGIKVLNM